MKFDINLSDLRNIVKSIGAENINVDLFIDFDLIPIDDIDIELEVGKEISVEQIQETNGLLTYAGRQVILYIQDHTIRNCSLNDIIRDGSNGNRFHITECTTLNQMKTQGRFDRYIVTIDTSGSFNITGINNIGNVESGKAKLIVCQNCLKKLNYKGFRIKNNSWSEREKIKNNFNILEFFEQYSSLIKHLPSGIAKVKPIYYTDDWKEISTKHKIALEYTCEKCGVKLINHKHLLQVHHINGVKGDNSDKNLVVLCLDCHKKMPNHQHMQSKKEDIILINDLRVQQGIIKENILSWEDVYKFSDTSLYGIIMILEQNNVPLPALHKRISHGNLKVELLWDKEKVGISLDENTYKINNYLILSHSDAVENENNLIDELKNNIL